MHALVGYLTCFYRVARGTCVLNFAWLQLDAFRDFTVVGFDDEAATLCFQVVFVPAVRILSRARLVLHCLLFLLPRLVIPRRSHFSADISSNGLQLLPSCQRPDHEVTLKVDLPAFGLLVEMSLRLDVARSNQSSLDIRLETVLELLLLDVLQVVRLFVCLRR